MLGASYQASLDAKQSHLVELFPDAGIVRPIRAVKSVAGCRNRARLAVSGRVDHPIIGFPDEHRRIVQVPDCPLHRPAINRFIAALPDLISDYRLSPYSIEADSGELKYVVITSAPDGDNPDAEVAVAEMPDADESLMVQWVLRSREAADRVRKLWRNCEESLGIRVMSINIQPRRTSIIQGDEHIAVSIETDLPVRMRGKTLFYHPECFMQTNLSVAAQLYATAADIIRQADCRSLLELYCGVGAFSHLCSPASPPATFRHCAMELSAEAIRCARRAAEFNGTGPLNFLQHDASADLPADVSRADWDLVICNPPRRGLDEQLRRRLSQIAGSRILYSSCNPTTLRRDLDLLRDFELQELHPFDMFPFTHHMEVLAVLKRAGT
ncbi:MAG: methyltransferase [Planctomycetaceae bacterium]|nr:methyltransferase [Planctomycetaceae bacterium]